MEIKQTILEGIEIKYKVCKSQLKHFNVNLHQNDY